MTSVRQRQRARARPVTDARPARHRRPAQTRSTPSGRCSSPVTRSTCSSRIEDLDRPEPSLDRQPGRFARPRWLDARSVLLDRRRVNNTTVKVVVQNVQVLPTIAPTPPRHEQQHQRHRPAQPRTSVVAPGGHATAGRGRPLRPAGRQHLARAALTGRRRRRRRSIRPASPSGSWSTSTASCRRPPSAPRAPRRSAAGGTRAIKTYG